MRSTLEKQALLDNAQRVEKALKAQATHCANHTRFVEDCSACYWAKITRGEALTAAEQTAWSNMWCEDVPAKVQS